MSDSRLKESNIEWLGEIPKDWNLMPIKYGIKNSVSGDWGTDPLKKSNQKKCICLRVADFDFDKGIFKQNQYTIRAYSQEKINQLKLQSGDILIEKSGGGEKQPVGRAVLFDKDFSAMFANFLVRIRTNKLLVPSFLEYYLRALYYTGSTRLYFNQTTGIQNLKVGTLLSNEKIPNISIALQNNITNYLNKRCKKVDDIIAKVQQEITNLEEYRNSIIVKAVTKGLNPNVLMKDSGIPWIGKIPQQWNIEPIYLHFYQGKNKNNLGKEKNLLSLSYGKIIRKNINSVGGLLPSSYNTYNIVEAGDIIIRPTDLQNDKRSLRTGLVTEHGIITSAYLDLKPKTKNSSRYYHYLLHAYDIQKVFYNMGNGVRQGLNFSEFSKLKILVPNLKNQLAISDYLDNLNKKISKIILNKKSQLEKLNQYKQSIIYEYVTGKKQVPTEEGAKE